MENNKFFNRLIFNTITFPSFPRRGGPGSGFVRAGIRSRAGVVDQLLSKLAFMENNKFFNRLIFNTITFPSFRRRGGPGSGFVRAGIRSRAGVVEENLMVIIFRLKRIKLGTSFLRVPVLLYFDLKTGWFFRTLNTY
jgi:hypothetical protein